jgi:anhydro-N-acetylmuramic acid kinase
MSEKRGYGANSMIAAGQFRAIGLMSGTSMDAIDAAVLETDGEAHLIIGAHASTQYPLDLRRTLLRLPSNGVDMPRMEREVTDLHCQAVRSLCVGRNIDLTTIDVIGFHGQTILHAPQEGRTWQLGDGQRMADSLGRVVVNSFRQNDMNHGGQGAPFAPAYHRALVRSCKISQPIAVLNIGGVSNVTWIDGELLHACDCGPGNALIDDWVSAHCGVPYDAGGNIAAAGRINDRALTILLSSAYFRQRGPKSLDRNAFSAEPVSELSPQDGAATLAAFTAAAIAAEAQRLPCAPKEWIVVGGGRLNGYLIAELRRRLSAPVRIAEELGWTGDAIEAQAFGYLAVRSILKLPLSWPSTTGVSEPVSGGVLWNPSPEYAPGTSQFGTTY